MKTLNQFIKDYEGKSVGYPDGKYVGECLSIVKLYIKECFGIDPPPSGTNSAYGYWSNFPTPLGTVFEKIENTPDNFPSLGDIVIWKPWETNKYGHIDICVDDKADVDGFAGMDQNWGMKTFERIGHDYKNVVGWLTPKVKPVSNSDNMTEEQKKILDFLSQPIKDPKTGELRKPTEGDVRTGIGYITDNVDKKLADMEKSAYDNGEKAKEMSDKYESERKVSLGWQSKYNTANDEIKSLKNKLLSAVSDAPTKELMSELFNRIINSLKRK